MQLLMPARPFILAVSPFFFGVLGVIKARIVVIRGLKVLTIWDQLIDALDDSQVREFLPLLFHQFAYLRIDWVVLLQMVQLPRLVVPVYAERLQTLRQEVDEGE